MTVPQFLCASVIRSPVHKNFFGAGAPDNRQKVGNGAAQIYSENPTTISSSRKLLRGERAMQRTRYYGDHDLTHGGHSGRHGTGSNCNNNRTRPWS
jgi:hypothetical protein